MADPLDDARYLPIPELSPYTRHDRYERPKEIFRHLARRLAALTEPGRRYRYADIATANGELLYYLRGQFPEWQFCGYDLTPEFIETGRAFAGLDGVGLHVSDLYDIDEQFDIVSFINVMTTMPEPEPPLEKLLSLVGEGGLLLVEGCFNKYDVEVRAVFMDNSRPESAGRWRRDCNQHSRRSIAAWLEGRCRHFEFEDVPMIDLPRREDAPHANVWTFRDDAGRIHITSGTNVIMDRTLLTIRR